MRPRFFFTDHAEKRFRERAGPVVFDPRSRRLVELDVLDRSALGSIANQEIARGVRIIGEARMHIATSTVQRYGQFSAEDELVAFDDHGWVIRNDVAVSSYFELTGDMFRVLRWPRESMRLIAHQEVSDQVLRTRLLGETVTSDAQLEDALRRAIRAGVQVTPARSRTSRFVGPFEAERRTNGDTTYQPMTLTCDVAASTNGNVVRNLECRLRPFVAEEHRGVSPKDAEIDGLRAPEDGLELRVGADTVRVQLDNMLAQLARETDRERGWWESRIVRAAPAARALSDEGLDRFFAAEKGKARPDHPVAFALDLPDLPFVVPGAKTFLLLASVGPRKTGQARRFAVTELSKLVLGHLNYLA